MTEAFSFMPLVCCFTASATPTALAATVGLATVRSAGIASEMLLDGSLERKAERATVFGAAESVSARIEERRADVAALERCSAELHMLDMG